MLFCLTGREKVVSFLFLAGYGMRRREGKGKHEEIKAQGFLLWSHTINHKALHTLTQHLKEPREVKACCSLIPNLREDGDKFLFVQH